MKEPIDIFIPSYHRPANLKSLKYLLGLGYPPEKIHVFVDSEADDFAEYAEHVVERMRCQLHVFDMAEARRRYDYVHRASVSRRCAGQARNMFMDFALKEGIPFYLVMDDDTQHYELQPFGKYFGLTTLEPLVDTFAAVRDFMEAHRIGLFGLPQTGDLFGNEYDRRLYRPKVMNTTFVNPAFVYRGERGTLDSDTSLFVGVMNEGLFTGSPWSGLVLMQTMSATSPGGLTDTYNECKLLMKSLTTVIQFPSAIVAEHQSENGGRLHHRIRNRYLAPKIIRGKRNNIPWDTYPEDVPFTNEPKRSFALNDTGKEAESE